MNGPPGKERSDGAADVDTLEHEEFLTRWSKRKALAREGVELPEPADDAGEGDNAQSGDVAEADEGSRQDVAGKSDGQDPTVASAVPELPPLESLDEDSDYAAFLAADVPADLQRQALRKLFRSPKFNVRDGLDDYDLDFSSPEPLGDIVTAEMRHRLRQELERLAGLDDDGDGPRESAPATVAEAAESEEREPIADEGPDDDEPATA